MRRILQTGQKFFSNTKGNVALMFGIVLFAILAAAGVAIDLQRTNMVRTEIQEATDASLIAAVRYKVQHPNASIESLNGVARRLFDRSLKHADLVNIAAFELAYDAKGEIFDLNVESTMKTLIMKAFGSETVNIDSKSQARLGKPRYIEAILALDVTGSMNAHGKLNTMKDAANNLVKSLFEHPEANVQIGVVPFAQYVSLGASYSGASWLGEPQAWKGCVGSRDYPNNVRDENYAMSKIPGVNGAPCPDPLLPLSKDETTIHGAIDNLDANGWTYIPSGLAWAWRALSPQEPLVEGVTYTELAEREGVKALILMTDGENTRAPSYPLHNSSSQSLANQLTKELCDNIKAEPITIYTIAFEVTDPTIRDILEKCAASLDHYFRADDSQALIGAFDDIATSLRNITLSR